MDHDIKSRSDSLNEIKGMIAEAVLRLDDLREAESRRVNEQLHLRSEYSVQLAVAEAKRIDAIRSVDVAAVAVASERAAQQAIVLANQVTVSAETLRNLVATTASTVARQLAEVSEGISQRLSSLEKSQYENKGSTGGMRDVWGWVFGISVAIIGFGITIYFATHK